MEWLLSLVSVVIGGGIALLASWLERRAAEKRLKKQLLYEKRTEALSKLYQLTSQEYKTYNEFKAAVLSFLSGLSGAFLPEETVRAIRDKYTSMDHWIDQNVSGVPQYSMEEIERMLQEYEEYLRDLPEHERIEMEFKRRLRELKQFIKRQCREQMANV